METHTDETKLQNTQVKRKRRLTALTLLFALSAAAAGSAFFLWWQHEEETVCCRTRGSGYAAKGRHGAEGFARRYGCREKRRRAGGVG